MVKVLNLLVVVFGVFNSITDQVLLRQNLKVLLIFLERKSWDKYLPQQRQFFKLILLNRELIQDLPKDFCAEDGAKIFTLEQKKIDQFADKLQFAALDRVDDQSFIKIFLTTITLVKNFFLPIGQQVKKSLIKKHYLNLLKLALVRPLEDDFFKVNRQTRVELLANRTKIHFILKDKKVELTLYCNFFDKENLFLDTLLHVTFAQDIFSYDLLLSPEV